VVKATGDIITVAGDDTAGYSGDGGLATTAELNSPFGVTVDSAGNLFITDSGNNVVREVVKATGDINTVAGNGKAGYKGDKGPATAAELNLPVRIAIDSAGDLFFADVNNNVVRQVTPAVSVTISDYLIVATVTPPGQEPSYNGPVLRFGAVGNDSPTPLPIIPPGPQTSLYDPDGAAFNPTTGELFIGNREGGTGGSISRFFVDAAGNYTPDGTITGNGLGVVSQLAFHDGELFAGNYRAGTISRFKFDAQGAPIPDGSITVAPYLEGVAFSPSGELFASTYSKIYRYLIDPSTGAAVPKGTIADPGSGRLHYLAFLPLDFGQD
jgi:hypothetical protein